MKASALVCFAVLVACKPKPKESEAIPDQASEAVAREAETGTAPSPRPATARARDLDRICNAEEQAGALDLPPGDRALHTAIWLANNIETQESRDFIAELKKLDPIPRVRRLKDELAKLEITQCEIIRTWGGDR